MRTIRLLLAYDGGPYRGWQVQPNGPTIQQELADAIRRVTGEDSMPHSSGRTDSGVHALAQVACFKTNSKIPADKLIRALNAHLPEQIVVKEARDVQGDFDPARDAVRKMYRYVYCDSTTNEVFLRKYCWQVHYRLDVDAMRQAASVFLGTHDFRAFETEWPNRKSSVRTVYRCDPTRLGDFIHLDVEADGFLYNMVRAFAGTLYEVGRGRRPIEWVAQVLADGKRIAAGPNAPAQGLFLVRVDYPTESTPETAPQSADSSAESVRTNGACREEQIP
jgi:tRNA pseudouridine38-40 synthase